MNQSLFRNIAHKHDAQGILELLSADYRHGWPVSSPSRASIKPRPGFVEFCRWAKIDGALARVRGGDEPIMRLYQAAWEAQRQELLKLCFQLQQSERKLIAFKSADILGRFFGSSPISVAGDIDILVERDALELLHQALRAIGFVQGSFDFDTCSIVEEDQSTIASVERQSYELVGFGKIIELDPDLIAHVEAGFDLRYPLGLTPQGKLILLVIFDVHHSLAGDLDPKTFWQSAWHFPGQPWLSLGDADQLWFLVMRFYLELAINSRPSCYRDLIYIAALLRFGNPDWDRLLQLTKQFDSRPALFYTLSFLLQLHPDLQLRLPADLLNGIDPRLGSRTRDWGWQIPKMLGLVEKFDLKQAFRAAIHFTSASDDPDNENRCDV